MNTIKNDLNNQIIIKNSKFIAYVYRVNNINEINNDLSNIKDKYKDASHVCYAYILDNIIKYSDDKEPNNTAGLPILNVLEKNNLTNILAIVIRYYGGIKLGANGLIRAYTKSIAELIKKDNIRKLEEGYNVDLIFDYSKQKEIDYILKDFNIINKEYDIYITYNLNINNITLEKLRKLQIKIIINEQIYL